MHGQWCLPSVADDTRLYQLGEWCFLQTSSQNMVWQNHLETEHCTEECWEMAHHFGDLSVYHQHSRCLRITVVNIRSSPWWSRTSAFTILSVTEKSVSDEPSWSRMSSSGMVGATSSNGKYVVSSVLCGWWCPPLGMIARSNLALFWISVSQTNSSAVSLRTICCGTMWSFCNL